MASMASRYRTAVLPPEGGLHARPVDEFVEVLGPAHQVGPDEVLGLACQVFGAYARRGECFRELARVVETQLGSGDDHSEPLE